MSVKMEDNAVAITLVLKMVEDAKKNNRPINIPGMEDINPFYEALAALLAENMPYEAIPDRFKADPQALRSLMVCDSLLSRLDNNHRAEIVNRFKDNSSLEEITDACALRIAEGKRVSDGKVLVPAPSGKYENKVLSNMPSSEVYLTKAGIEQLEEKAEKIKERRIYFAAAMVVSSAMFFTGYCFIKDNIKIDFDNPIKITYSKYPERELENEK